MPPHLKLSGNMKRNMVCEIKRYHMLIRFSSDKHMVPFYFTPNIFSTSSLCGRSLSAWNTAAWFRSAPPSVYAGNKNPHSGAPGSYSSASGQITQIRYSKTASDSHSRSCPRLSREYRTCRETYKLHRTCGSGSAPSPDHRSCPSERHFSVRIPAAP